MTAHDSSLHRRPAKGLLGWLRGAGKEDDDASPAPFSGDESAQAVHADPRRQARAQVLGDIADFLLNHDLEISPFTLTIAHDYLNGGDGRMMRRIDERLRAREPLTSDWLERTAKEAGGDQAEVINRLMHRLETNMEAFDRTSTAAKSAASDYTVALTAQVDGLDKAPSEALLSPAHDTSEMVHELVGIARNMLERTATLEQDMARSMLETRALRRSLEQARRSAEEDHLTGLPNRRAFEQRYAADYKSARDNGEQLAVAFCDIDNFKRINDEHGHEAGDRVLKNVAAALSRISDDRCHVARHGGEEFVVLLRGRSLHQAWELLDDARSAMAERRMVNRANDTPFGKVTFSAGVADVFAFPDPRSALRGADRALYRAKAEGRNRVLLADANTDLRGKSDRRES
ncbi:GGDEF domain-containing protein [Novosphingobium umbonatum]|uniref:diguanylate cyclase n=1 Tax=Novosphingobium umbonatum TaxID=1908524 RepID=A0A437N0Y2_9SPHN|nr:GGDEF domain-containing protein [Novosphingobium umbonatum]RVU03587.1 GGDEF domain-containing protein [Novosphingobium umbonatum]